MAAGPSTDVVINDFGRIGRTCFGASSAVKTSLSILWPSRGVHDPEMTRHLLKNQVWQPRGGSGYDLSRRFDVKSARSGSAAHHPSGGDEIAPLAGECRAPFGSEPV